MVRQAKAVWEKREDFAGLERNFHPLLNAEEDEELSYDREKIRRMNPVEPMYVHSCCLDAQADRSYSRIVMPSIKPQNNKDDLVSSSVHHNVRRDVL